MALSPNSVFRGVAAAIPQPASEEEALDQLSPYIVGLTLYNNEGPRILYREPDNDNDLDIREAVYRWDERPPEEIFRTGFTPRPQSPNQDMADYYNLEQFVNGGGAPGEYSHAHGSVFVSTTRSTTWRPRVPSDNVLYRYQIYAPGGIDAVLTLRERNCYPNQQEISFAGGISRQYIRLANPYTVNIVGLDTQFPQYNRLGNDLYINEGFNPNPGSDGRTPESFMRRLRNPSCPSGGQNLIRLGYERRAEKRDVADKAAVEESNYVDPVCSVGHYIECAFNFSGSTEAYLFIADQCLLIDYAPGTKNDRIIKRPLTIGDAFPCLKDTIFASGIDAAFTARTNKAYIFRSNIYALIKFTGDSSHIVLGPTMIIDGFHSLKNTIFANGIDAAFAAYEVDEAYIFKGDQYALINFAPDKPDHIIQGPKKIADSFPSLRDTLFQGGLDAAFSSTSKNEAYIFKGDTYALIDYAPGTTNDYIINGPITPISKGFPSLKRIIPMYPCGC